jgi:mannose-6-phosphate isomerase-like protein (cupin superfamily)
MDWHAWMDQHIPATVIQRGGATVWPKGGQGLIGDSLGPIMHLHDGASEIFYFVAGRCRLEIGNSQEFYGPGDLVLIPPEVPHNVWNAGDDDLLVFWIVAPNFVNNKWRVRDFPPGAMERRAIHGHVAPGVSLPGDSQIRSQLTTLSTGHSESGRTTDEQETVIYLVEGSAQVKVGKLGGVLAAHEFIHVPLSTAYSITPTSGALSFILFEMPGR